MRRPKVSKAYDRGVLVALDLIAECLRSSRYLEWFSSCVYHQPSSRHLTLNHHLIVARVPSHPLTLHQMDEMAGYIADFNDGARGHIVLPAPLGANFIHLNSL